MAIKAIETEYNGYRFRSRLEARWAVFFDEIGIKYQYELEGFEVKTGGKTIRYLPDFYLPELDLYCEIKPNREKLMQDAEKLSWMIDYDGPLAHGLIILGQIPNIKLGQFPLFICYYWDKGICAKEITVVHEGFLKSKMDLLGNQLICEPFSAPDFNYPDTWDDLYFVRDTFPTWHNHRNKHKEYVLPWYLYEGEIPINAFNKARQARFEHGEKPMSKAEIEKYEKALIESW